MKIVNGGIIREAYALNNLLACTTRFGTGEFTVPLPFWKKCVEEFPEMTGLNVSSGWVDLDPIFRHLPFKAYRSKFFPQEGYFRRILSGCNIFVTKEYENRVLFQPWDSSFTISFTIGQVHSLRPKEDVVKDALD